MFLTNFEVENICSIEHTRLDLTSLEDPAEVRKWTLLVGENGVGKSTLLKGIALLLAGSDALPHLMGEPGRWVRNGASHGRLAATLVTADHEERTIELVLGANDFPREVLAKNAERLAPLDNALSHASQNYFVVGYGPYRRVADEGFSQSSRSRRGSVRSESLITLFDKDAMVNPLTGWAMSLEYREGDTGLALVKDAVSALMPQLEFVGIDRKRETLIFQTQDGEVPLEQLSDGYLNVAAWLGDLLYRITDSFAHYSNPLSARGLLLIDEVDAHLHPAWQRRLRSFLDSRLTHFQIIATTHSALTLQQSKEGEAWIMTRDEDARVETRPLPVDPSKMRLHEIYDLAFKIDSLDSWEIEQSKKTYRELMHKHGEVGLSAAESVTLRKAVDSLEALPPSRDETIGNEALGSYLSSFEDRFAQRDRARGEDGS